MGRDDRELIVVESPGGAMKWMLIGAAVGAGLALLFAPRTGREMRQEIGRGVRGLKDMAEDAIDEIRGGGSEAEEEADEVSAADERPVGKVTAREELEKRLAAARARRRATTPQEDEEPVA